MKFTKMHGLGNDYIYVNCFEEKIDSPEKLAIVISDRHFGVGGDGLVLIIPSQIAAARMQMFNADGSEAMCGNALRCVAKYLYEHHLVDQEEFVIETVAGIKNVKLQLVNNLISQVSVDMGKPILEAAKIPILSDNNPVIGQSITVNDHIYQFTAVSMGNPHCIIFVPKITDTMVLSDGPLLEVHPFFPQRTNVEFVVVNDRQNLTMRVWERGTGETLACGTGACATLVAAVLNHKSDPSANIHLRGGDLAIAWDQQTNSVKMTGPATEVFEGEWKE